MVGSPAPRRLESRRRLNRQERETTPRAENLPACPQHGELLADSTQQIGVNHGIDRCGPHRKCDRVGSNRPRPVGQAIGERSSLGHLTTLGHWVDADNGATMLRGEVEAGPPTSGSDVDENLAGAYIEHLPEFVCLRDRRVAVRLVIAAESLGLGSQQRRCARDDVSIAKASAVVVVSC
jgi:hypothetical protein